VDSATWQLNLACGQAFDAGRRIAELEQALVKVAADRDRLLTRRLVLLDVLGTRAAALQAAHNYEGARSLMALVKVVADG
jgi:hypothetical protein